MCLTKDDSAIVKNKDLIREDAIEFLARAECFRLLSQNIKIFVVPFFIYNVLAVPSDQDLRESMTDSLRTSVLSHPLVLFCGVISA